MTVGLALPDTDHAHGGAGGEWTLGSLTDVLKRETKLLADLVDVLRRQRSAVREDDLAVVDETVYSAQRIFRTLAEARRRRQALLEMLGAGKHTSLDELDGAVSGTMPPEMEEARADLKRVARRLSRELNVNRKVLKGAIASGEDLIRGLTGRGGATGVYGPGTDTSDSRRDSGTIINRQI